jgi:hypothetical protein
MNGSGDKNADLSGVNECIVGAVQTGDQGRQEAGRW